MTAFSYTYVSYENFKCYITDFLFCLWNLMDIDQYNCNMQNWFNELGVN